MKLIKSNKGYCYKGFTWRVGRNRNKYFVQVYWNEKFNLEYRTVGKPMRVLYKILQGNLILLTAALFSPIWYTAYYFIGRSIELLIEGYKENDKDKFCHSAIMVFLFFFFACAWCNYLINQ